MSDLSLIPLQDWFETQLSQDWDGNTGTVYVLSTPSYTPTTENTYIVVNPWKTNMQIAEITDYDSTAKTLTVSSISFEKGLGISSTAQSHSTGSKVIISDNYQFWEDIQTAVNSKVDGNSDDVGVYKFANATARDAFLTSPTNGLQAYLTTEWYWTDYIAGAWVQRATWATPNAEATVAGKVEIATSAESIAGTDTGGTGAKLVALPSDIAKNIQSSTFIYGSDAGGDDAYVVAYVPAITALTNGMELEFSATTANTGACTLDAGTGALAIKTLWGNAPANGDVIVGINRVRYNGTNWTLLRPTTASTAEAGLSEMATDAEAQALTDQSRYVNPYQLGLVIPSANSYPNSLVTSASYNTLYLMPSVGTTADAISNGWTENAAIMTASQWGGGIILFDTWSADAQIYALLPWYGSQAYFRFADIWANAITVKTRVKFGTSPSATEAMSWGFNTLTELEDYVGGFGSIRFCLADNTGDKLYAVTGNGSNTRATNVTGSLTLTNWLNLAMVITSTQVLFYAWEGSTLTLVATHTSASDYLPTSTTQLNLGWGIVDNGSQPDMYFSPIYISLPTT